MKEGTNTLTFDALSDNIPDIDYIDFYVGMRYISSVAELTEGTLMKDLETFDTEYASTREDWANANPDKIVNGLGLETVTKESEGKTTSGGKSVAALNRGSQLSTTMRLAKDSTIKLEFIAAKVDDYKVKENWEFYIDGFKLELVEDRNIKGGNAAAGEYWDWIATDLGSYNLTEGDHFFLIKNTGSDCNIDGVQFTVVSSGSYDESGSALDNQKKPEPEPEPEPNTTITKAGETRIEAENLDLSKLTLQPDKSSNTEVDSKNPSNHCVCSMNVNSVLSFTFKLDIDANVQISALMAKYESSFSTKDKLEVKLNDTTLAVEEKNLGRAEDGSNDWHNWIDVKFGGVQSLSAGTYTLTLKTLTDSNANIDCFILNTTVSE